MKIRGDGSVQSTNVPTWQNVVPRNDDTLYRCMVEKVLFIDDPNNLTTNATNPEVLYNVVILGGPRAGGKISNCRLSSHLGGNNNFYERVLRASTKKFGRDALSQHNGDVVFVQFTQGHSGYPVITACDGGVNTAKVHGAKKSDGHRERRQYNGIFEEINKDGEYTFIRRGGVFKDGELVPNKTASYQKQVLKNEIVNEQFLSGLNIKYDGKDDRVVFTTANGAIVDIDGKGGKITLTKGETIIELDSNTGKIALKGALVDLGASVSDLAVLFTELATAFNSHTHTTPIAGGSSAGAHPTTPPTAPLLASVSSLSVAVQK